MKGKSPGENMCTLDNRTRAHLLPYSYFKNSTSLCSLLLVLLFFSVGVVSRLEVSEVPTKQKMIFFLLLLPSFKCSLVYFANTL